MEGVLEASTNQILAQVFILKDYSRFQESNFLFSLLRLTEELNSLNRISIDQETSFHKHAKTPKYTKDM